MTYLPLASLKANKPAASKDEHKDKGSPGYPMRLVLRPSLGTDGLFVQPKPAQGEQALAEREMAERVNRINFASHFHYEDPWTRIAPSSTYDVNGNYNCGTCNKRDGDDDCLIIPIDVSFKAGSCQHWEIQCAGDREIDLSGIGYTAEQAAYGEAKNGVGFGCHRCPYATQAYQPDSVGRSLYCGKGDFRVPPNACCALNGADIVNDWNGNDPVKGGD